MEYAIEITKSDPSATTSGYGKPAPERVLKLDVPESVVNRLISTVSTMCSPALSFAPGEPVTIPPLGEVEGK